MAMMMMAIIIGMSRRPSYRLNTVLTIVAHLVGFSVTLETTRTRTMRTLKGIRSGI